VSRQVLPLLEVFQTSNRFFSLVDGVEFSPRSTGTFFQLSCISGLWFVRMETKTRYHSPPYMCFIVG